MQKINLSAMSALLNGLPEEELVPTNGVNPYLLEHVIRALLQGKKVRYGDLDYDQFEDQDLRLACRYCDELESKERELLRLADQIQCTNACAVKLRAFC